LRGRDGMCLADVALTDGGCDDKNNDQMPVSEELQRINDELEKQYLFVLKKVDFLPCYISLYAKK